jgi:transcriptional regulator with XRE-family HTH domain
MDDRTVGLVLRALRRRRGWRQSDLAARAGCSQALVSSVERGHGGATTVDTLRLLFGAVDARLLLEPRWRGAELDRLLDSEHAAISVSLAARLEAAGWAALVEVTYAVGSERGSIDVLGVDAARRAALVCEVKTDIPSAEATGRKVDEKRRLAPAIVRSRLGWTPDSVGAVLVLPESTRLRDILVGPAAILTRMFPIDARGVSAWLREPIGPLAATLFLRNITARTRTRIQRPGKARSMAIGPTAPASVSVDVEPEVPLLTILR